MANLTFNNKYFDLEEKPVVSLKEFVALLAKHSDSLATFDIRAIIEDAFKIDSERMSFVHEVMAMERLNKELRKENGRLEQESLLMRTMYAKERRKQEALPAIIDGQSKKIRDLVERVEYLESQLAEPTASEL